MAEEKKDGKKGDSGSAGADDWSGDFDAAQFGAEHGDSDDQHGGRQADGGGQPGTPEKGGDAGGVDGGPLAQAEDDPLSRLDDDPDSDPGDNGKPEGNGKVSMRVEPHEDGDGHRVHFHDDVSADLRGDADYQHHVTEHSKHYAGYLIHKDSDPDKAAAHKHAANLHARVGNALHAGGDTEPRRQQAAERASELEAMQGMDPAAMAEDGAPGEEEDEFGTEVPVGFGQDEWNDGDDVAFPGVDEESPREDAAGGGQPAKPDKLQNIPGRDSRVSAQRRAAGKPAPKLTLGGAKKSRTHTLKKSPVRITW